MKIRKDFVTNSSSTSFIIGIKEKDGNMSKDVEKKLLQWAKNELLEYYSQKIANVEDLNQYFIENYGYKNQTLEKILEDEYHKEKYEKMKKMIEDNFVIYEKYISCESQDEHLEMYEDAFEILEESKDYKAIDISLDY
jgi:hypothetical protein